MDAQQLLTHLSSRLVASGRKPSMGSPAQLSRPAPRPAGRAPSLTRLTGVSFSALIGLSTASLFLFADGLNSAFAGDPLCPHCVAITCAIDGTSLDMDGPALSSTGEAARLVIDDGLVFCEYAVTAADLSDSASWSTSIGYDSAACGSVLTGATLEVAGTVGGTYSPVGTCD